MAIEFIAPSYADAYCGPHYNDITVFLAGTIENGRSRDWQREFADAIRESHKETDIILYNPRRLDWDPSWSKDRKHPKLIEQIEWELDRLEKSDIIVFNFEPNTISPISLAEIGRFSRSPDKVILVHCPDGYARATNVDVMCRRFGIEMVDSFDSLIARTQGMLDEWRDHKNRTGLSLKNIL